MGTPKSLRATLAVLLLFDIVSAPGAQAAPPAPSTSGVPSAPGALGPKPVRVPYLPVSIRAAQAPPTQKILVDAGDREALKQLAASGAVQLADYGAFSLWSVTGVQAANVINHPGVTARPDFDAISLRGGIAINTDAGGSQPSLPDNLRQAAGPAPELWMAQFVGPIKDEWLAVLIEAGLEIVIYMPSNAYVVWGEAAHARLAQLASKNTFIQWTGAYHPGYRLAPSLQQAPANRDAGDWVDVTVQFYRTANTPASLERLLNLGGAVRQSPENILVFTNVTLQLPVGQLVEVAGWPDVFNVEPWVAPELLDEIQDQILTGNVINVGGVISPSAPGYLAWLTSKGFPTTPAQYPIVDIVDDGIDQGSASGVLEPDFHELGNLANPDRVAYIANCTGDPAGDGEAGHGHLNAGIVGAYNNRAGSPHVDSAGYRRGLGLSPYGRIAGTKIFDNAGAYDISACGNTDQGVVAASYTNGANFTSNSWGAPVGGAYNASAQAYDALTRDAHTPTPGNQQMLHIFAAGNDGPAVNTVGSPGTAKNLLAVGATENVRDQGISDGCGTSAANDADDIASFSSRGPANDGRVKPEIMAPGTHVQGPASKDPGYNGTGVCGASTGDQRYYPSSQITYTWSSGTSHSTPAIAGAASLAWNYYGRALNPGQTPSPAMLKALLINTTRYLNGSGTGGTLPNNNQGWGDANLGTLTDGTPFRLLDQALVFSDTGQSYVATGAVVSTTRPFRVSLIWSDAPGSTTGNAYVNDLNLVVSVGGVTYRGNVFSGAHSAAGGSADFRNNVENVFVQAGVNGSYIITVTTSNIAGDGVPGNGDPTDQDFALVIYNAAPVAESILDVSGISISDAAGGRPDGVVDPGETIRLDIGLFNSGNLTATGVSGVVAATGGNATMVNPNSAYVNIKPGATVTNTIPYTFAVNFAQTCGQPLSFVFTATYNVSQTLVYTFSVPTGAPVLATTTYTSTNVPVAIPDSNPAGVTSILPISATGSVGDVDARFNITHTWDADLIIRLIPPAGTVITLVYRRGAGGDNFTGTIMDDEATTSISGGTAPFTGRFQPESPLSALDGQPITGTWRLRVSDVAPGDIGSLNSWSLDVQPPLVYRCSIPEVRLSGNAYSVAESDGAAMITATLSVTSALMVTANYTVGGGTALAGSDYVTSTGALTFTPGVTNTTLAVPITDDTLDEADETFILALSSPANAALGIPNTTTLTIRDNDPPPAAQLSAATQTVLETVGVVTVTLNLGAVSGLTVTAPYTVSGTATGGGVDHSLASGALILNPGVLSASITFTVTNDTLDELDETVIVMLGAPTNATLGATTSQTITIQDDGPPPTAQFSASAQTVAETVGTVTVTLNLGAVSGLTVTAPYTVSGTATGGGVDHSLASGAFILNPGVLSASITFTVTNDILDELDETVIVTLGTPTNATLGAATTQTIIIQDDDAPMAQLSAATQTASETVGMVTVTLNLSAASVLTVTAPYTVSGTATGGGVDHSLASGAFILNPGVLSASITFMVTNDTLDELDETVIVTLSAPANAILGATTSQTITIQDDDVTYKVYTPIIIK